MAIEIEVHTDFTAATERQKPEIVLVRGHAISSYLKM
jgi:hypothetical protein